MKIVAMIPARLASTRFPEKLIRDLAGAPVIVRTYEAVKQTLLFDEVYVVTDSKKIETIVLAKGAKVLFSSTHHATGSDRLAEAASKIEADLVINVQGDEPFIDKQSLERLIEIFKGDTKQQVDLASLMTPLLDAEEAKNPNVVKVITDLSGRALYFSRSVIPFNRSGSSATVLFKHKGVYAFRKQALVDFSQLAIGPLEQAESIEAIRFLEHGRVLQMIETPNDSIGIDTLEDLERAEQLIKIRS